MIVAGGDFGEMNRRQKAGARRGAQAKKWMATQTTNVLAEARNGLTAPVRLEELAINGNAAVRLAVAGNASAWPATLLLLTDVDLITSEISQKLTRNPTTPRDALLNIHRSTFAGWFGNRARLQAHPNWPVGLTA